MNSRQRYLKTMDSGETDRVPLFEEGIREGVLEIWGKQDFPAGTSLPDLFIYDQREEIALNLETKLDFANLAGLQNGLEILQQNLDPEDQNHLPEGFYRNLEAWQQREHILMLLVHQGFFLTMGVEDWRSFSEFIYLLMDQPDFVLKAMQLQGEFAAKLTEKVLQEVEIDAVIFSEPIGGNHGSLISLDMYRKFVSNNNNPIMDVLTRYGVKNRIARTYANTHTILPALFESGINCLWACECNPQAMDYSEIRRDYGEQLCLIGGLDLDILRGGKDQFLREIEARVIPLLEQGKYIPLLDGRVREDISFENYTTYRKFLEEIVQG